MSHQQLSIASQLGVAPTFDAAEEIGRRSGFLAAYAHQANSASLVLGISGGVDSTVAGRLCQLAAQQLRARGHSLQFIAVRLPYGVQADEDDARRALDFIRPDRTVTVDIRPAADAMLAALKVAGVVWRDPFQEDFVMGNIKARQRMIAQYALAGTTGGLVVGTDHAAEALTGFFTKYGDGGFDLSPLGGLSKRRVRQLALALDAPPELVQKQPTADLETLRPQRSDEAALGISYEVIDDFLEGRPVDAISHARILEIFRATAHKRALPVVPYY